MKRILFSLLTCGMCLSAFAQVDTSKKNKPGNSDKWEIIKANAKAVKSKLFVSLPEDAHWDMTIYAAGSNKVLSNTLLKKEFLLLPGSYDVEINKIRITGVPVEKGNNTRIKAGVLDITVSDSWSLYGESYQPLFFNNSGSQKRGLPIGKFKLSAGFTGSGRDIEIKDGVTTEEDYTQIETKSDYWVTSPSGGVPNGTGRLYIDLDLSIFEEEILSEPEYSLIISPTGSYNQAHSQVPQDLPPGVCTISWGGIQSLRVPILEGKKTRLRAGYLKITVDAPWKLDRVDGYMNVATASVHIHKTLALPPGQYKLEVDAYPGHNSNIYDITIKDREIVINGNPRYTILRPGILNVVSERDWTKVKYSSIVQKY